MPECYIYTINGQAMSQVEHTKHLGVHRESNSKVNVTEKIALGRRTAYSQMGAGLHSGNSLKQGVCGKLWSAYMVSHLTYRLEVFDLKCSESESVVSGCWSSSKGRKQIWATSWQNQQNGMCAQRRIRSACTQRRLRSAWASGCPGWSESSLGAHAILLVLSWGGSYSPSLIKHRTLLSLRY